MRQVHGADGGDGDLHLLNHHLVSLAIARSALGQSMAVVLILVALVVYSGEHAIKPELKAVADSALISCASQERVTEDVARIMADRTVQAVIVERDTLERAASTVSTLLWLVYFSFSLCPKLHECFIRFLKVL